jgi:hypothetical protein
VKFRIAIWAATGFLVAGFWSLYFLPTAADIIARQPAVWTFARLTCPISFASHFGFGVSVFGTLIANAITYALVGFVVETLRHRAHTVA